MAGPSRGEIPGSAGPGASSNGSPRGVNYQRRTIRVINPRGLHPRIIDLFTKTAKQFASSVTVWNGDLRADGKSVFDLILLVVLPETDVILEVEGPDASEAIEPLTKVLASAGGEDYII